MSMQSGQAVLQAIAGEWSMEGFSPAIERRGQDSNGSTTITKILVRQADGEQASPKRQSRAKEKEAPKKTPAKRKTRAKKEPEPVEENVPRMLHGLW